MGKAILLNNIKEVFLKMIILVKVKTQESFIVVEEQSSDEKDLFFNLIKNYFSLSTSFSLYSNKFTHIPRFVKNKKNKKKKTTKQRFNKKTSIVSELLTN